MRPLHKPKRTASISFNEIPPFLGSRKLSGKTESCAPPALYHWRLFQGANSVGTLLSIQRFAKTSRGSRGGFWMPAVLTNAVAAWMNDCLDRLEASRAAAWLCRSKTICGDGGPGLEYF